MIHFQMNLAQQGVSMANAIDVLIDRNVKSVEALRDLMLRWVIGL